MLVDDPIIEEARARHELHKDHPTHRPLSEGYELVGLRGEEELARALGLEVDMVRRPRGDGGIDNVLCLSGNDFVVDVKCARKPRNLIVEVGCVVAKTIYVLASYSDEADAAELLGWQWGKVLLDAPTKDFGYGVINHYIPRGQLRDLEELKNRHTPKSPLIPHHVFLHYCHCGEWGWFGYGVSFRNGLDGEWFCAKHRPAA
jgi:hypothetical protein